MSATTERSSVYALMDDKVLERALGDLERMVAQLHLARGPVASKMLDAYRNALDQVRAEVQRRRI